MPLPVCYHHVDVFAPRPYRGNSLAVFPDSAGLTGTQMGRIAKELRHFESIFLAPADSDHVYEARVFDLFEELDFAGHPVIGAACVLHALGGTEQDEQDERWIVRLKAGSVDVRTERRGPARYAATLDQGAPVFLGAPDESRRAELASWFSLDVLDLDPVLAPEVVSTGLRYLVLPVLPDALPRARIALPGLDARLSALGAQFAYLVATTTRDATVLEGRHWNNDGVVEDVATGSGAGCVAAYLRRRERLGDGEAATLRQGRFVGRPSEMTIRAHGHGAGIHSVEVGGEVVLVGEGRLDLLPDAP
jgi:trans-2,3-dihydro-3-hydroxyanthranilate isomerase